MPRATRPSSVNPREDPLTVDRPVRVDHRGLGGLDQLLPTAVEIAGDDLDSMAKPVVDRTARRLLVVDASAVRCLSV